MAKLNYNSLSDDALNGNSGNNYSNNVDFFMLKNDNDEAIVRFVCDSVDDMDIQTIHTVTVDNKYRKVACIRDPREPIDNCPLCKNNTQISNRFFIRLLQYTKVSNPDGTTYMKCEPKVWERSVSYAKTLKSYLENYGPLSDVICKIIRHGKAGDMQTTYEIVPNLSKQVYRDDIYVKDLTLFGKYDTLGTIVMDKTFDEMAQFLATGSFPAKPQQDGASQSGISPRTAPTETYTAPDQGYVNVPGSSVLNTYNDQPAPAAPAYQTPQYQPPQYQEPVSQPAPMSGGYNPQPQNMPNNTPQTLHWDNNGNQGGFIRPTRY